MTSLQEALRRMRQDAALQDVPEDATCADLELLLARDHPQAFRVTVVRMDGSAIEVRALARWSVKLFKCALRRRIEKQLLEDKTGPRKRHCISWRKVWKDWQLVAQDGTLLDDNQQTLSDYGIRSSTRLTFQARRSRAPRRTRLS